MWRRSCGFPRLARSDDRAIGVWANLRREMAPLLSAASSITCGRPTHYSKLAPFGGPAYTAARIKIAVGGKPTAYGERNGDWGAAARGHEPFRPSLSHQNRNLFHRRERSPRACLASPLLLLPSNQAWSHGNRFAGALPRQRSQGIQESDSTRRKARTTALRRSRFLLHTPGTSGEDSENRHRRLPGNLHLIGCRRPVDVGGATDASAGNVANLLVKDAPPRHGSRR
jgi:hypothetical protein